MSAEFLYDKEFFEVCDQTENQPVFLPTYFTCCILNIRQKSTLLKVCSDLIFLLSIINQLKSYAPLFAAIKYLNVCTILSLSINPTEYIRLKCKPTGSFIRPRFKNHFRPCLKEDRGLKLFYFASLLDK